MVRATDRSLSAAARRAVAPAALTAATIALGLLAFAGEAMAVDSISVGASASPQAGVPMTITARGSSSAPSTLRVFVQQGGDCASGPGGAAVNADRQAARSGSTEVISQQPDGAYSYAASYTPPAAGGYSICAYMFRSSPTSSASSQVSNAFAVAAPAAQAGAGSGPGDAPAVAKTARCVVPRIGGRTYETARKRLHRAGCIVGKVTRPSKTKARPLRPGGRRRILRVRSYSPKAGTVLKARGRVALRLVYVTPKTASKRN